MVLDTTIQDRNWPILKISSECLGEFQESSHFKTIFFAKEEREELPAEKRRYRSS